MATDTPFSSELTEVAAGATTAREEFTSHGRTTGLTVTRRDLRPRSPLVSVVVLNWNGGDLVTAAVDSVAGRADVECIVVDNASTDGSSEQLLARGDVDVHVACPENLGYARGMNIGCRLASAPLVLLLNCDAAVPGGYLDALVAAAARHPDAAMFGGPSFREPPHDAGTVPAAIDAVGRVLDAGPMELTRTMRVSDLERVDVERTVTKVTGSCTALRLPLDPAIVGVTDGSPFDESFVTYGEDIDLACRIWRAGHDTVYVPALWSWHERSFASGRRVWEKRSELRRNVLSARYRNVLRHVPGRQQPLALALVAAGDLALVLICLARGDLAILRDVPVSAARGLARGWGDRGRIAAAGPFARAMPRLPFHARRRRAS